MATTKRQKPRPGAARPTGVAVITQPDIRWRRCDIKSVSLLPNVLGKQAAAEAGAFEAWQVDDDGMRHRGQLDQRLDRHRAPAALVTRNLSAAILIGITRLSVLQLARIGKGIVFEERRFSVAEAKEAAEAFLTSTTSLVLPVTRIDGQADRRRPAGSARPMKLRDDYLRQLAAPSS